MMLAPKVLSVVRRSSSIDIPPRYDLRRRRWMQRALGRGNNGAHSAIRDRNAWRASEVNANVSETEHEAIGRGWISRWG